jgi:hypothetical protein
MAGGELELWNGHTGTTTQIVGLGGEGAQSATVAGDGMGVVFTSRASLTGYPNGGLSEVFVYDATAGRLHCASCNPTGEPPTAYTEGLSMAAFPTPSNHETYRPRWISRDGSRVFFNSFEPLVPQDTNAVLDVYEWERDGAGSCTQSGGCIYLLSGGTGSYKSWFIDASSSGDDVFILTRAQLAPEDRNENYDLYDVRAGGSLSPPAVCSGAECEGGLSVPPVFGSPSSLTFAGAGNLTAAGAAPSGPVVAPKARALTRAQKLARALKACRKKPKRRRAVCKAQARKSYGPQAKKSAKGRK